MAEVQFDLDRYAERVRSLKSPDVSLELELELLERHMGHGDPTGELPSSDYSPSVEARNCQSCRSPLRSVA